MSPNKNLRYYLDLPFPIEITQIPEDKGGGFMACIPQLGRMVLVGDGNTVMEAIQDLERAKASLFREYLEKGIQIPEPEDEDEYSGRFVMRMPKYLHRELSFGAKRNKVSLNSYIISLLSGASREDGFKLVIEKLHNEIRLLKDHVCELKYRMPYNMVMINSSGTSDDIDDVMAA